MSYWNEIENVSGKYDFDELDNQINRISKSKGSVSLCLGARQPRWPENHWPEWAWKMPKADRTDRLLRFIERVVTRYKQAATITSYQLENEALLSEFGKRSEIDRLRLRSEFLLVKQLDTSRPIIMSTSTSWGIPFRQPIPDVVGFSFYQKYFNHKQNLYKTSFQRYWLHINRANLIRTFWNRPVFIHELQLEPWGPGNIWEMSFDEQMKSMSPDQIRMNISLAKQTRLSPVDLWGGEWWYWCARNGHPDVFRTIINSIM